MTVDDFCNEFPKKIHSKAAIKSRNLLYREYSQRKRRLKKVHPLSMRNFAFLPAQRRGGCGCTILVQEGGMVATFPTETNLVHPCL